jgi:hypothetical protein
VADSKTQIINRIQNFIKQGEAILGEIYTHKRNLKDPNVAFSDDARTKFVGVVGSLDLGIKKLSEKHARAFQKSKRDEQRQRIETYLENKTNYWIQLLENYFSNISIQKPNLTKTGNSKIILKKIIRFYQFKKPETKLRNGISLLKELQIEDLIHNSAIEQVVSVDTTDYDLLKLLENKLRSCIETQLSKKYPNWWIEHIPNDVRGRAEERKTRNETLWPWSNKSDELIHYIDFNDYIKIITRRDNWREVFIKIFDDKDLIRAKLKELDPIRNAIAHTRPLSSTDRMRLKLHTSDIISCIDQ